MTRIECPWCEAEVELQAGGEVSAEMCCGSCRTSWLMEEEAGSPLLALAA